MSDDSHLPTPLAHGRWAGDRVGRSAREAGASLQGRSSPERRAASGTRVAAKRVAMVLDVGACLGISARGAEGCCLQAIPWSLRPLRAECCRRLRRRRRPARRRHRRLRHRRLCRHDCRNGLVVCHNRGFPARHPGGVARPAAAAARPHPARRRRRPPRHQGRAEGAHWPLRACCVKESEELLFNTQTSPAMCGTNGGPAR